MHHSEETHGVARHSPESTTVVGLVLTVPVPGGSDLQDASSVSLDDVSGSVRPSCSWNNDSSITNRATRYCGEYQERPFAIHEI